MMHVLLFHILMGFGLNALGSEIINGRKTKETSMLYMASVQSNGRHICGGFLVSKDFVVTAAHCDGLSPLSVVLGTKNLKKVDDEKMRYSVTKCKHPSYVNPGLGSDIMLLKLNRQVTLDKKKAKPIRLPKSGITLTENATCVVAGWGYTRTGGDIVDELQVVDVPIINTEKCQKLWRISLPDNIMCAGGYGTNKGFCQGDSGGPLLYKGTVVGIVSFNSNFICDYPNVPNVYTDISKYLPWIKNIILENHC